MELYPNVYQIQSLYKGRNLFQYFFNGPQRLLLDTGIAETPEKAVFPYLEKLKLDPPKIDLAITTHSDLDHQGGNNAIKQASPNTLLACGEADRELVEDPQALYDRRYNHLKKDYGVGMDPVPSPDAGKPRAMDLTFSGGESLRLADDWRLRVLHVPGHSRGHLALYDPGHKAAFVGDAVHGRGCPKAAGGMAIPVTYYQVDVYLSTLRYFETLPVDVLYSGHWPVMSGEEFHDFLAESRQTVELFDRVILLSLARHTAGLTLREIIDAIATAVGEWPEESWDLAMFPAKGHLDRLLALGKIRVRRESLPVRWERVG
ncbi:MAG: MBL fold metallo-hydrolase [Terriglobia bacterium]